MKLQLKFEKKNINSSHKQKKNKKKKNTNDAFGGENATSYCR